MRIIKEGRVKEFVHEHPKAARSLERWVRLTRAALWRHFLDVRATFPDADKVKVASGNDAMVFDIGGNKFRLITAVHYMKEEGRRGSGQYGGGRVYVFYLLTHAEYDFEAWKETL